MITFKQALNLKQCMGNSKLIRLTKTHVKKAENRRYYYEFNYTPTDGSDLIIAGLTVPIRYDNAILSGYSTKKQISLPNIVIDIKPPNNNISVRDLNKLINKNWFNKGVN